MKVTIQSRWDLFNAMVLPHDLPVSERNILKMAFYAGVLTMMDINYRLGAEDVTEEQGCKVLNDISRECREYVAKVKEQMPWRCL